MILKISMEKVNKNGELAFVYILRAIDNLDECMKLDCPHECFNESLYRCQKTLISCLDKLKFIIEEVVNGRISSMDNISPF